MTRERDLIRLQHGELDAVAASRLRARLAADRRLADRFAALERRWRALEPPPSPPAPSPSLRPAILAAVAARPAAIAPRFLGAGLAAALIAGLVLGFGYGRLAGDDAGALAVGRAAFEPVAAEPSLAEAWLAAWRPEDTRSDRR